MKKTFLAAGLIGCLMAVTGQEAVVTASTMSSTAADKTTLRGEIIQIVHKVPMVAIRGTKGVALMHYQYDAEGLDHVYKGMNAVVTAHTGKTGLVADSILSDLAVTPSGVQEIGVMELISLVRTSPGDFTLLDVRPASEYQEAHIASAISLPLPLLQEKKEAALPASAKDSGKALIFYCDDDTCSLGTQAAAMAVQLGYRNVKVFLSGIDTWKRMGQLLVSSYDFVNNGNIALIDLRTPADYEAGHIAKAVNIPIDTLPGARSRLPVKRYASIVVYGSLDDEEKAINMLTDWHYGYVTRVENGLPGYSAADNALVAGRGPTEVAWERQVHPGEVAYDSFEEAVDEPGPAAILDVRNQDETKEGTLPNAITIPLDQLETRIGELDKNKEIYIYCASGARARMASYFLNDHGFHTKYLVGHLTIDYDGSYFFSL